jgi:hypothetical protein
MCRFARSVARGTKGVVRENESQFALPARITFRHLYFSPDKRGAAAHDGRSEGTGTSWPEWRYDADGPLGRSIHVSRLLRRSDHRAGGKRDGQQVCPGAASIKARCMERAGGVRLRLAPGLGGLDYAKPRPEFDEVALADIKTQWLSAQRAETKRELFTAMRAHYEIVLPKPFSTPSGPGVAAGAPALEAAPTK